MAVLGRRLLLMAAEMLLWTAAWLLWSAQPHSWLRLLWLERRLLWAARVVLDICMEALDSQIELWLQRGLIFADTPSVGNQRKSAQPDRDVDEDGEKNYLNLPTYD